ncbi:MAG: hypothetical protein VW405_20840, partial [Rhodospirillaceae bacterium]
MNTTTGTTHDDGAPQRRVNFNTVAGGLAVGFGVLLFWLIPTQIDKPLIVLGASQASLPPELFPQLVATAFLILGAWLVVKSFSLHQH